MRYEIATLRVPLGGMPKAIAGVGSYTSGGGMHGTLLGCWTAEIGTLNRLIVLRGFDSDAELQIERQRLLDATNPFGCGDAIAEMDFDTYAPFSWMPPIAPGKFGTVYEIRTYRLKPGGGPPTSASWQAAMVERGKLSPLVALLHSIDGPSRITHIWPYASIDARFKLRAEAVAQGIWPPKGAPEWLTGDMQSTIALPTAISPLA